MSNELIELSNHNFVSKKYPRSTPLELVTYYVNKKANPHKDNEKVLRNACMFGQILVVKYLINEIPNTNVSILNNTPFYTACENGHFYIVKYLFPLLTQIPVHACQFTANCGDPQIMRFLYENQIEMTLDGMVIACQRGHLSLVEYLVDKVDIHGNFDAPLRHACLNKHIEIVEFLLEKGAYISKNLIMKMKLLSKNGDKNATEIYNLLLTTVKV